jgi:hypothetical protein
LPFQNEGTLEQLAEALKRFHGLKEVFSDVSPSHLKFPKMHMITHYLYFIRRYGTLDNMDTEYMEHAHIPFVKIPYRYSNKRDPLPQIMQRILRQSAIERKIDILDSEENTKTQPADFKRRVLSSQIKEGPLTLNAAEQLLNLRGLETALKAYFQDKPSLDNDKVFFFFF